MKKALLFLFIHVIFSYNLLLAQEYVEVIVPKANIMSSPSSTSLTISQASNGNVFELQEEKGLYFGIYMFSGEMRYLEKSHCKKIKYTIKLPESIQLRKTIYREIIKSEDKALADADKKYSYKDVSRNTDYRRLLNDKYKLDIFNKYNIQPAAYFKLIGEGIKNHWN